MAGVGFELRKSVKSDRHSEKVRGYLGAAFSTSGSMIVAIFIFILVQSAAKAQQIRQTDSDSFMCYITNAMFLSILVSSLLSPVLSRYVSNAIWLKKPERVFPSLVGGCVAVVAAGGLIFAAQLLLSGTEAGIAIPLFFLFVTLCVCWLLMTYITLIRDYKRIVIAFALAFVVAGAVLFVLYRVSTLTVPTMILVLLCAFATVDIFLFRAVYLTFFKHDRSVFAFRHEFFSNPALVFVGFLMSAGMLGHFWMTWFLSDSSSAVSGLFRFNAKYDFPAIAAYFSTIPAAVYFITIFETDFSEKYQRYFAALRDGAAAEVDAAKEQMILTMRKRLRTLFLIQLISCLLFITAGSKLLGVMNIGMTEGMLRTFRMFCAGYSLYYIGSTLILLRLWFADERRAVFTALLFAVGVFGGTAVSVVCFGRSSGVAFTAVSMVMTLLAGAGLVIRLKKLEYHIFCRSDHTAVEAVETKRTAHTVSKKRLARLCVAACLALVITLGSAGWMIGDAVYRSNIITFEPKPSSEPLLSPGMGLAPWADSDETKAMQTSLVYVELKWSDWEPEDDRFDVDFVNEHYHLGLYRKTGRQVVFRFICDNPTEQMHIDIPQWLYDLTHDGEEYDMDYGRGYSPNYLNETFIEEHAEAVAALGDAFGKDDFFVYVELGSLGHWGEWHINYESGLQKMPPFEVRDQYIKPYLDAFPNARLLLRYPLIDAKQYSMGLYNDQTGDYDETLYWMNQMSDSVWEQTGLKEQADCSDSWKTQPIGGEFGQTQTNAYFLRDEFDMTLEAIRMTHQSFIGPKIIIDEEDANYTYQMNEILKTIGYRYRVDTVEMNFSDSDKFSVDCKMVNDGIAPVYDDYALKLNIYDSEGTLIRSSDISSLDLKEVLPDKKHSFSLKFKKDDFDDDAEYTMTVSAQKENGATLPMAMVEEYRSNEYIIAKFFVK